MGQVHHFYSLTPSTIVRFIRVRFCYDGLRNVEQHQKSLRRYVYADAEPQEGWQIEDVAGSVGVR